MPFDDPPVSASTASRFGPSTGSGGPTWPPALRDLFGNPFLSVAATPSVLAWNDGCLLKMAEAIYNGRALASCKSAQPDETYRAHYTTQPPPGSVILLAPVPSVAPMATAQPALASSPCSRIQN